jgi:hypothetical protein
MIRVTVSHGRVVASELDLGTVVVDSPYVEVTRTIVNANADAAPSGGIGRSLARLMREVGLRNVISQETFIHVPLPVIRIAASAQVEKCVLDGRISEAAAANWWTHLEKADAIGELQFGAIVFTAAGEKT